MKITQPLPILSRLTLLIDTFIAAVWAYRNPRHGTAWGYLPGLDFTIVTRVMRRMRRAEAAVKSLMVRFRAGKLRPSTPRGPLVTPRTYTPPALKPLPNIFAWLCPLMPAEAVAHGYHIGVLLAEPEMQQLLAASPRAVQILKPIFRMLGIDAKILTPDPAVIPTQIACNPRDGASQPGVPITPPAPAGHRSATQPPANPPERPVPS
jgi:hypothetical protein